MGLLGRLLGDPEAVAAYRKADDERERLARASRDESDEWHEANDAMWEARKAVPWWRR